MRVQCLCSKSAIGSAVTLQHLCSNTAGLLQDFCRSIAVLVYKYFTYTELRYYVIKERCRTEVITVL